MKKIILIPVAVLAVYFVFFIAVRVAHHGTVSMTVADAHDAQHTQTFQATCFIAPMSGFGRVSSRVLFGSFYPLGRIDHLISGRLYEFVDQRKAPIPIIFKDLGVVEVSDGTPIHKDLGGGRGCVITPTVFTNGSVRLTITIEETNSAGVVRTLARPSVQNMVGQEMAVSVGDIGIRLTPQIKP